MNHGRLQTFEFVSRTVELHSPSLLNQSQEIKSERAKPIRQKKTGFWSVWRDAINPNPSWQFIVKGCGEVAVFFNFRCKKKNCCWLTMFLVLRPWIQTVSRFFAVSPFDYSCTVGSETKTSFKTHRSPLRWCAWLSVGRVTLIAGFCTESEAN